VLVSIQDRAVQWRDRYVLKSVPRASEPYSSHLPVLIGLASLLRIDNVLEFGAGVHSTPLFINKSFFTTIQEVHTYENDAAWGARVQELIGADPKLHMHWVESEMEAAARVSCPNQFDLIFIDDSVDVIARSATIRAIAALQPTRAIVVIHDFEVDAYRRASASFDHRFRFRSVNPNVGVLWNGGLLRRRELRRLSQILRANGEAIRASNTHSWARLFEHAALNSKSASIKFRGGSER
jgi:hypothetical protein